MSKLKYFGDAKTDTAISKRYRELAKQYHPDKADTEAEKEHFTTIMQEVNEEHREILVLLKYKALEKQKVDADKSSEKKITKKVSDVFNLTKEQKNYLVEQGRNMLLTLYDNIVENNLKK